LDEADFNINEAVVIKHDNLFLVARRDATLPVAGEHHFGLYYNDCRFLSGWQLTVLGDELRPLASSDLRGDAATHELTGHQLHVRVARDVVDGRTLEERITISSFAAEPVAGELVLQMRSGFEPLMWLRGLAAGYRPQPPAAEATADGVTVAVTGRDGVKRAFVTAATPAPESVDGQTLRWQIELRRGQPQTIALRHAVAEGEPLSRPDRAASVEPSGTRITTNSELFNRVLDRSFADLRLLRSRLDGDSYYAAGVPWYATLFGRDSLIVSMEMLAYDHEVAAQTLRLLAANLGASVDDERDEEPGKVVHELRLGELANLGVLPFARYYGSVDATPLFLCLLTDHADWAGDLAVFEELSSPVDSALSWIDQSGDRDGDGLLEYQRRSPGGLENQGWKDSPEGVPDGRGRPLRSPIALIEAQAYALRAKRRLARLFDRAGKRERGTRLRAQADELADKIGQFWLESERFYAMALDADKHPSRALASNQGHALWSAAVSPERAAAVRAVLMSPEMFSGWGIRTLSSLDLSYNPLGYHTGSVWPHDTALTAHGLRKYGYDEDFTRVFDGLVDAASRFPDYRLPELFGGFSDADCDVPVPYPVACRPQAWAAGSIPYMLATGLGLVADGLERRLRVVRPSLPAWLTHVAIDGLDVAGSKVHLTFQRAQGAVTLADVQVDGDVEVVLETGEPGPY
jgi:glycogen debranching enzyme